MLHDDAISFQRQHRRFLRSLLDKENAKSKAEKALAFLVESGVIYLCILVYPDQLLLLCTSTDRRSLAGGLYHNNGMRHRLGNSP
jgi:hypothetical protein